MHIDGGSPQSHPFSCPPWRRVADKREVFPACGETKTQSSASICARPCMQGSNSSDRRMASSSPVGMMPGYSPQNISPTSCIVVPVRSLLASADEEEVKGRFCFVRAR